MLGQFIRECLSLWSADFQEGSLRMLAEAEVQGLVQLEDAWKFG